MIARVLAAQAISEHTGAIAVVPIADETRYGDAPRLTGRSLIPASRGCSYPPAVEPHDLLDVDFDERTVTPSGDGALYLVEMIKDGRVVWYGCRRFGIAVLSGALLVDDSGTGDGWGEVDLTASGIRIVGRVHCVYRPTR